MKSNIEEDVRMFGINKEDFIKVALKFLPLFAMQPETLNKNIEESARIFGVSKENFIQIAIKSPNLFSRKPESLKNNIETDAKLFDVTFEEFTQIALKFYSLFIRSPETLYNKALLKNYEKEIKGKKEDKLINCLTTASESYIFSNILKYLICKADNITLPKTNPTKIVQDYLTKHCTPDKTYEFTIPQNQFAQKLVEYAENLSTETLKRNAFKFKIK